MERITKVGQPCRNCGTPVEKKIPKKWHPKKAYWYAYYLWCPMCDNMYMLESERIENPHYKKPAWQVARDKIRESASELDSGYIRNVSALERIVKAPSGSPASMLRRIAQKALDGVAITDIKPLAQ